MSTHKISFNFSTYDHILDAASNFYTLQKKISTGSEFINVEGDYPYFIINLQKNKDNPLRRKTKDEGLLNIIDDYLCYNYQTKTLNVTFPLIINLDEQKEIINYLRNYDTKLVELVDEEFKKPNLKLMLMINDSKQFDFDFERSCSDMTSFMENFDKYQDFIYPILITYLLFKYYNNNDYFTYTVTPNIIKYIRYLKESEISFEDTEFNDHTFSTRNVAALNMSNFKLINCFSQLICFTNMSNDCLRADKILKLLSLLIR